MAGGDQSHVAGAGVDPPAKAVRAHLWPLHELGVSFSSSDHLPRRHHVPLPDHPAGIAGEEGPAICGKWCRH